MESRNIAMVRFKEFLIEKKTSILHRWLHLILETYSGEASKFMGHEKDPFINPVGSTIAAEIEALYGGLLQGKEIDPLSGHLDKIIQIRAVQDFSPSGAVAFIPLLKKAIRQEMERIGVTDTSMAEWVDFESKVDQLTLTAFDIYAKYREKIYEVRMNEIKKDRDRTIKILERTASKGRHRDSETGSG